MGDIEHERVSVIYTDNHLTDVIADDDREPGDVGERERAVDYVRADLHANAVAEVKRLRGWCEEARERLAERDDQGADYAMFEALDTANRRGGQ